MAKNCIIYEKLDSVGGMNIQRSKSGLMQLSGVFGVCGVRNNNHRVYETSNYAKMVSEMKERIKADGSIPGELEHPQQMNITLENISHKITDINIDENGEVTGTIELLDTPKGKLAQAIVEGGLPLFISSRATGQVDPKNGNVTLEKIATYDLVGSPGFSQAKLHLNENQMLESINESQVSYILDKTENNIEENKNNEDMELDKILERLESLESDMETLREENEELREQLDEAQNNKFDIEKLANGIQKWIVEEYSPEIQKWIVEEFAPEYINENNADVDEIVDTVKESFINDMAPKIQNWIVEEYSPEIQNWAINEFAPEVQNWTINEFAPGIQNWVVNEFAPEVDTWVRESYNEKVVEQINDAINESKSNNLDSIDKTLSLLEGLESTKPTYSRKSIITENLDEPKFIANMPAEKRVKFDMASEEVKESITRRAKLYNLNNDSEIERFWESVNFDNIKPVNNIYEGLESIQDERERAIRASLRKHRRF